MDYIELGRRIRALRRQKNMTQAKLAEKTGVSTSFIGHIERGSRVLSLDTFVNLCAALDAEPNDLLCVEGGHGPLSDRLTKAQKKQLHALLHYASQLVQADKSLPCVDDSPQQML